MKHAIRFVNLLHAKSFWRLPDSEKTAAAEALRDLRIAEGKCWAIVKGLPW